MIKWNFNKSWISEYYPVSKKEAKVLVLKKLSEMVNGTFEEKVKQIESFNLSGITVAELFEVTI